MTNKTKVLDFGYVKLLNLSGPVRRTHRKEDVVEMYDAKEGYKQYVDVTKFLPFDADCIDPAKVARISFNNHEGERARDVDLHLCDYLIKNKHTSPSEMIETWWELKVPMFLGEQIIRHRTASINKVSGRYSKFPSEWYIPEIVGGKAKTNKQGQEDNLPKWIQLLYKGLLNANCWISYKLYTYLLFLGVAPEHARLMLHANQYTTMVWKMDLHNLMHFLELRLDAHAQVEARAYAREIYNLLEIYLPDTMKLFSKYRSL